MKSITLAMLTGLFLAGSAWAQYDSTHYQIIFGNRDGSVMVVKPGLRIEVPVWGVTDPNNQVDSIATMHIPLASSDNIVLERLGGFFPDTLVGRWANRSFREPDLNSPDSGFTNQSMLGWCYDDSNSRINYFFTDGDTVLICTYLMTITNEIDYFEQIICPFLEGNNPQNRGIYWGTQFGTTTIVPIQTYGCLYIDPIPHIIEITPSENQRNLPTNSNISATFDLPLDQTTINDSTFVVNARSSGLHSGIFTYDSLSSTSFFDPLDDFAPGEVVNVTLTTGIKSIYQTPMDSSFTWSFTVKSSISSGEFDSSIFIPLAAGAYWLVAADFDNNDSLDIATANTYANSVSILLNDPDSLLRHTADYAVGQYPKTIFAADFNGDGALDLATADSGSNDISILLNNGDGTFSPGGNYASGGNSWGIFCSDFSGDGNIDIAVTTGTTGTVAIFINNGDGTFPSEPSQICQADGGAYGIYAADFDLDHHIDLAITSGGAHSLKIFLNDGNGDFPPTPSSSYQSGGDSWSLFSSDLNRDGWIDLIIGNKNDSTVNILLNNGDGTFPPTVSGSYQTGGDSWDIFCGDFDGDGDIDIAISNGDGRTITLLLNQGDGTFLPSPAGSYDTNGDAWGIFGGDLNGDGTIDLAVGNSQGDPPSGENGVTLLLSGPQPNCPYTPGDINGNHAVNGIDIVYAVNYLKGGPAPPEDCFPFCPLTPNPFFAAGDVNGNCAFNGIDITYFVRYLKLQVPSLLSCQDCPPGNE